MLALVVSMAGCGGGPLAIWSGRSPDRDHRAVVLETDDERQRFVVDGVVQGEWDAVAFDHLLWSNAGPVVPVQEAERWQILTGTGASASHEAVGFVRVVADRLIYAALDAEGWRVVVDGEPGPAFQSLRSRSLVSSQHTGRIGYVANDASGTRAVVDGVAGPAYPYIGELVLGGKGTLVAYAGYGETDAAIVVNGHLELLVDDVLALAAARDEPRWAAVVERADTLQVIRDGEAVGAAAGAVRELVISPDGSSVAWTVDGGEETSVWVNGSRIGAHTAVRELRFVARSHASIYVAEDSDGARVVHSSATSPRFDEVEALITSEAGHWGYVGRRGALRAVVVDGEPIHRGDWAGGLQLAARGSGWAYIARTGQERYVVTGEGRILVAGRPFVDTLVLSDDGQHWAVAVADTERRRLRIVVDGRDAAPLDMDEIASALLAGGLAIDTVRSIVRGELGRLG